METSLPLAHEEVYVGAPYKTLGGKELTLKLRPYEAVLSVELSDSLGQISANYSFAEMGIIGDGDEQRGLDRIITAYSFVSMEGLVDHKQRLFQEKIDAALPNRALHITSSNGHLKP